VSSKPAPWMRTGKAAKILGVSRATVQRWCREGVLGSRKTLKGQYLVSAIAIDALVHRMVEPPSPIAA
jgi:excisionase family DNA binding protein